MKESGGERGGGVLFQRFLFYKLWFGNFQVTTYYIATFKSFGHPTIYSPQCLLGRRLWFAGLHALFWVGGLRRGTSATVLAPIHFVAFVFWGGSARSAPWYSFAFRVDRGLSAQNGGGARTIFHTYC